MSKITGIDQLEELITIMEGKHGNALMIMDMEQDFNKRLLLGG